MSSLRSDNSPSATSSVASTGSSLDPGKHLMRTLCFNRKSTSMPSKEDYALLLRCGLGKWRFIEVTFNIVVLYITNLVPPL